MFVGWVSCVLPASFLYGVIFLYITVAFPGSASERFPLAQEDGISSRNSRASCIKDCSTMTERPICGSDGQTYNSRCELKNARCIGRKIRVKHKGPCPVAITREEVTAQIAELRGQPTCIQDCSTKKPRLLCGTDGLTYNSKCELKNVRCMGRKVGVAHQGACTVEKSKCLTERAATQQLAETSTAGVFIPQCNTDGSYATVQCHVSFGYCWCVTEDGRPIPGSSVRNQRPSCNGEDIDTSRPNTQRPIKETECSQEDRTFFNNNLKTIFREEYDRLPSDVVSNTATDLLALIDEEKKVIDWKFTDLDANDDSLLDKKELRDLRRLVKKIVKPKKCAKTLVTHCDMDKDSSIARTEWLFCLGVDNNEQPVEDPTADSEKDPSDPSTPILITRQLVTASPPPVEVVGPHSCEVERKKAILEAERLPNSGVFIPQCTPDGEFNAVQCHEEAQYCWCVFVDTGRPIPGTSSKASNKEDCRANATSGSSGAHRIFEGCMGNKKEEFLETMLEWMTSQMLESMNMDMSASDGFDRPTPMRTAQISIQERVARWKFRQLDLDNTNLLEKTEIRPFKKEELKSLKASKTCRRNFVGYCDADSNGDLSMGEWLTCLEVRQDHSSRTSERERQRLADLMRREYFQ